MTWPLTPSRRNGSYSERTEDSTRASTAGKQWQFLPRFAAAEYYRIAVDMSTPYRIAGGLQDNLNWLGPSMTRSKEGILNSDWVNIGGGDGFYCVFDPFDTTTVYAESQGGEIHRFNLRTGETKGLQPRVSEGQQAYRYHWNTPFIGSVHTKGVMYLAGNHVWPYRTTVRAWHVGCMFAVEGVCRGHSNGVERRPP